MSYLDIPRLHFSGRFRADVCTMNNDPNNYALNGSLDGGFNPYGTGNWTIEDCTVKSVVGQDGVVKTDDALVGHAVKSMSPGKLVDLDPGQMMVSEIWGLRIQIGDDYTENAVYGHFEVAPFMDIWSRAAGKGGRDNGASAYYQSRLTDLTWASVAQGGFLAELQAASPNALSIKFTVDRYNMSSEDDDFTYGRIVGTIGPVLSDDEPQHFVAKRLLRPKTRGLNYAPFQLTQVTKKDGPHHVLTVDLGNSIPADSKTGEPAHPNGELALIMSDGPVKSLGEIDTSAAAYTDRAFIQEFDLNEIAEKHQVAPDKLLSAVENVPLMIVGQEGTPLLAENDDGLLVRAEKFVYRLNPPENGHYPEKEEERTVSLHVSHFGQPLSSGQIELFDASNQLQGGKGKQEGTGTPATALSYPSKPIDIKDGKAQFVLTPSDPGTPRPYIDGQIYGVGYKVKGGEAEYLYNFVSVIVHTLTTWDESNPPTWDKHISPIFAQYARLYQVMSRKFGVHLDSYDYVSGDHNGILQVMFSEKMENPAYMPVTRDLSHSKHKMIMAWFKAGMPKG